MVITQPPTGDDAFLPVILAGRIAQHHRQHPADDGWPLPLNGDRRAVASVYESQKCLRKANCTPLGSALPADNFIVAPTKRPRAFFVTALNIGHHLRIGGEHLINPRLQLTLVTNLN